MKPELLALALGSLSVFGLFLLHTGLARLRFGRLDRVCPLCGYDLSKVPGRTCIECGFVAQGVDDLYPGGSGWGRLALGVLALSPGVCILWPMLWADPDGRALVWHGRWVLRAGCALVFAATLALAARTLLRDRGLARRGLPHKRGRLGRLTLAALVCGHATLAALAPRGVQNGWSGLPPAPLKSAALWVIDQFKKP